MLAGLVGVFTSGQWPLQTDHCRSLRWRSNWCFYFTHNCCLVFGPSNGTESAGSSQKRVYLSGAMWRQRRPLHIEDKSLKKELVGLKISGLDVRSTLNFASNYVEKHLGNFWKILIHWRSMPEVPLRSLFPQQIRLHFLIINKTTFFISTSCYLAS